MAYNMLGPDLLAKRFTLSRWILKGPADTWRAQLEAYYQAEPVFALLGGISEGDWEPVHRFCEDHRLPNLFPVVDYPVLSDTDWYTLYLSRGVRQEGEAAARYLNSFHELFAGREIVQVFRDNRRGQALADGFRQVWKGAGHAPASEIPLAAGEQLTGERLQQLVADRKPAVLLVWDDATALPALSALAGAAEKPQSVIASATWLGEKIWPIEDPLRSLLYLTYPFRLPQEEARFNTSLTKVLKAKPWPRRRSCELRPRGRDARDAHHRRNHGEHGRDDGRGEGRGGSFDVHQRVAATPARRGNRGHGRVGGV
jgi:hypothetical protein